MIAATPAIIRMATKAIRGQRLRRALPLPVREPVRADFVTSISIVSLQYCRYTACGSGRFRPYWLILFIFQAEPQGRFGLRQFVADIPGMAQLRNEVFAQQAQQYRLRRAS